MYLCLRLKRKFKQIPTASSVITYVYVLVLLDFIGFAVTRADAE